MGTFLVTTLKVMSDSGDCGIWSEVSTVPVKSTAGM